MKMQVQKIFAGKWCAEAEPPPASLGTSPGSAPTFLCSQSSHY